MEGEVTIDKHETFPLISVILPVFNREAYVAEAIESALAQGYPNMEIIALDDGSTDGSAAEIRRFEPHIRYYFQENGGLGSARNAAVTHAAGDFLAFLDSDDLWLPGKLSAQMAQFGREPGLDAVYHRSEQFFSPEVDESYRRQIRLFDEATAAPLTPVMLIRRASFDRVGPFSENRSTGNDMEWYARMRDTGLKVAMLDEVYYRRRIHYDNMNSPHKRRFSQRLHVLKEILDRRRQESDRS